MTVRASTDKHILRISFSDPKANSLNSSSLSALESEFRKAASAPGVRVIGLESEGEGAFCAGASFDELQSLKDTRAAQEFFLGFARVMLAMRDAPQFVVTRVHGRAVGGALGLIAVSDYAIGSVAAEVRLSELNLGIGPFVISPALERRVGISAFSHLSIETEFRSAEWAQSKDLYAKIYMDSAALDAAYESELSRLSEKNLSAMTSMKRIFWQHTENWNELFESRAQTVAELLIQNQKS